MAASVLAVSRSGSHTFTKPRCDTIRLIAGLGVEGDAHLGETVKHRSHVRKNATQPNLRQVHLIHAELLDELVGKGFSIAPGDLGENITTSGIALLDLPAGARLQIGKEAIVQVTGLRNPCHQIDKFCPGLLAAVVDRDLAGEIVRKTGVMGIVIAGGEVHEGDAISVTMPAGQIRRLEVV